MRSLVIDALRQEVRFTLRPFVARSNRTAIAAAVFTLGIAIASCTIILSLLDAALFRPLGYGGDEDRMVSVGFVFPARSC